MEKKRKLATFKIPKQTTIMDYQTRRKKHILDPNNKENTSPEQCVIDAEPSDPTLDEATQQSFVLLNTQADFPDDVLDDFAAEIRVRYGVDRPINVWPKYSKERNRYVVERIHRGRKIMLETIPIHRCLYRRVGYAKWTPSPTTLSIQNEVHEQHLDPYRMNGPILSQGTEELVLSGSVSIGSVESDTTIDLTANYLNESTTAFKLQSTVPVRNPSRKTLDTPLFSSEVGHEDIPPIRDSWTPMFDTNVPSSPHPSLDIQSHYHLASDPVSAILDELYEEDRFGAAELFESIDQGNDMVEMHSFTRFPTADNTQLFESLSARSISPIPVEDDQFTTKRIVRKALLGQPEGLSSSQDMFAGYGIGFSAVRTPKDIVDHHECGTDGTDLEAEDEPEGFVNLKKAKESGQISGLENYFNQFDAAPPKRRQSKSIQKSKPKKQWRGKNARYKRKNK
jgi:hypothetical protein